MNAPADDPLLSVAERISDGAPVDWNRLQDQISTPEQTAVAEELRSLERFARAVQETPKTWGRFQIVAEIGRGTFGTVYRAIDPTLQLEVALKVSRSHFPSVPIEQEKALEEARRLVKIKHPNVVRAYGAECIGGDVGLSMELVKGHTLDEIVKRQAPFSAGEAAIIGLDLCRALAAVHGAGQLHGDIKAHNVMREEGGRTVLMDFGTGRDLKREPAGPGGDFAGTPLYLAPEVFAGQSRTAASDIYSMGVLLYFLVTGSYPVEGDTRSEIGRQHDARGVRRPLRDVRPDLPEGFIHVVERAIAEDPGQRYDSAGALEAALAQVVSPPVPVPIPDPRPTWRLVLIAASAVLVIGLGTVTAYWMLTPLSTPASSESREVGTAPGETVASGAAAPAATSAASVTYSIDAAFYREQPGSVERLQPGAQVAPGDALSLQVQVSVPAYVYVVTEDEQGESLLLFPLPGQALPNPLPPAQRHRLPGMLNGEPYSWQVTTAGQREHFLIFASPERSPEFEELFATLPQPAFGRPVQNARLSPEFLGALRSVGGLTTSPVKIDRQLRLVPEFSTPLTSGEETVQGRWVRHAVFENPGK